MATRRLGRGLEALLVDVPNEFGFAPTIEFENKQFQQDHTQLLQAAKQLQALLEAFEQLVLQLEPLKNQTL